MIDTKAMRRLANGDVTDWHTEVIELCDTVDMLVKLLDEADRDDMFGTEGWRHYAGVDE